MLVFEGGEANHFDEQAIRAGVDGVLRVLSDAFGDNAVRVKTRQTGVIIGLTNHPVVNQGDAVVHVGTITALSSRGKRSNKFHPD